MTSRRAHAFNALFTLGMPLLLLAPAAHAGRPLVTEDAGVLAGRDCEWESAALSTRQAGSPRVTELLTQLGCGIGLDTQAALAVGRARSNGASEHSLALLGKTGLVAAEEGGTAWTLAWGLVGYRPTNNSLRHDLSFLNLVVTHSLGDGFTGHANAGLTHSRSAGQTTANWNLALEWAQRDGLEWMGEVYGAERSKPWLGLGVRWSPSKDWSFNASLARQSETPRVNLLSLGFKLGF
jgi:hypothetical protein